jgi:hypothetical protein
MKYSTANMRMSGKKLIRFDSAPPPAAPCANALEISDTLVSP